MTRTDRQILHIALPSIVSNITVPLLGLIDVSIVGHLGAASYIGAIAVGGMLFNMIYWLFGFLRMGTGGLTAQAYGRHDLQEVTRILLRSLSISLLLSLALLLLQYPIRNIAFMCMDTSEEVRQLATLYFHICIWGAPATLGLYGFTGWYIGMQNSRFPMFIAITQNIVNIAASLFFVFVLKMKVEGVALGTLVAQYAGLGMACLLWLAYYRPLRKYLRQKALFDRTEMKRFFQVNRDIFFRTLCLIAVTVFFTSTGAAYGDVVLAVNALLMQLFTLFSYFMDGFAYAGEALTGKYIGAKDNQSLRLTIRHLFKWGIALSLLFTLLYGAGGKSFLGLLTNDTSVISASEEYIYWVLAIPLAGFSAFLLDGICIGATATHLMLRSMLVASASFFLLYYGLHDTLGNHALWMAFIVYLALRGVVQGGILYRMPHTNLHRQV
ncbi:MATE family efflux transporter [Phocaeicola plebeius]|jgi:MATE efflux family protein|uniref:MATE family efflux transporter n=2 Tax=Phocaeicola plebeius TaxID=310297 RepID=UPI0026E99A6F|nr:MATE family efflux transporter [Phocaeicola plebeius]